MRDGGARRRPKLHLQLSADDRHSGEMYRAAYSGIFDASVSEGLHGSIEKIDLGGPILSRSTVVGQQIFRRTIDHIRRSEDSHLQIVFYEHGSWRGDYGGRSSSGSFGGLRLIDTALPMVHASQSNRFIALSMPRDLLGLDGRAIHGLSLTAQMPGVRLLAAHLQTLWDIGPDLTPLEASAAVTAGAALLKGVVGDLEPTYFVTRSAVDRTLRALARHYVDKHLGKNTLTPRMISTHLNVSPRTLYRAFEPVGGVSAYIQGRRLDKAYDALTAAQSQSIADVAYASGFVSASHFSRAFRARFGVTPGELRTDTACTATPATTVIEWLSSRPGREPAAERACPTAPLQEQGDVY